MKQRLFFHFMFITTLLVSLQTIRCGGSNDIPIESSAKPLRAIIVSGNSAIRIDPIVFSSRVALLKKGEVVDVLEQSKLKTWIGDNADYFYKVRRQNGVIGWTFGTNLKVISSSSESIDAYISSFMKDESKQTIKALTGKWWSINSFGDFTTNCLEIYEDNRYKSYTKGSSSFIEGEYSFDFNKNQILFLKGTTFGNSLDLIKRGQSYVLQKEEKDQTIQFKKIASEIKEVEPEKEKSETKDEAKTE